MGVSSPAASEVYADRERRLSEAATNDLVRRDRLSRWRLIVFGGVAVMIGLAIRGGPQEPALWLAAATLTTVFLGLVHAQQRAENSRARHSDLAKLNRKAIARTERAWDRLPPADHPEGLVPDLGRDLGLFGHGSVFQLLGTAATALGRRRLAEWLVDPAPPQIVRTRQAAVRELASMLDLRQEVEREAGRTSASSPATEAFLRWAESTGWTRSHPWQLRFARAFPAVLGVLVLAHALAGAPPLWIGLVPVSAILWLSTARAVAGQLSGLEVRAATLASYARVLDLIERAPLESQRLLQLQEMVTRGGVPSADSMRKLQRITELAEVRHSPLAYIPLQLAFVWDVHIAWLLDRWRAQSGVHAREWLEAVAEFEALSALAGLSFDNPDWAFPTIDSAAQRWDARELAHPLLQRESRVANDVQLGLADSLLLVTGSNMSGKSTLLRSIGTNVILAHAGAPVCAAAMTMPPTRLGTSFVIEDSLHAGVSYFMAELLRLRALVREAVYHSGGGEWRYLFLLDEILKGTNSGERQIAVRQILLKLLHSGASGAISSHDLALADVPELRERSVPVHFRDHFSRRGGSLRMDFDYRLRPGVATTTNALALLEVLGVVDGDGSADPFLSSSSTGEDHPSPKPLP